LLGDFFVHRDATSLSRPTAHAPAVVATSSALGCGVAPLVLMADGDAVSRDLREAQLRTAGFRVSVARTGFEAIVKACCQMPDVILLDESVTGIEAAETVRMLRTCPTTTHIPIVRLFRGRRLAQRTLSRLRRVAA
jgi:CheY-like chemotaxis protein